MSVLVKEVKFNEEAKEPLINGVNTICDAVASTMGYRGRTVLIESPGGLPLVTKDGVSVADSIFLEGAVESLGCEFVKQGCRKTVSEAGDGPQPLYSKILTPNGWIKMGDVSAGDIICGSNNTIQNVLDVFPKGEKEVLNVIFSDGRVVECCEDHLWTVTTRDGIRKTITAKEMIENEVYSFKKNGKKSFRYFVETTASEFNKNETTIDPYLLGLLLGDGSLGVGGSVELSIGYKKKHVLDKIKLPEGMSFEVRDVESKNYLRVKFFGNNSDGLTLKDLLNELGLLGSNSHTKFIPKNYLYSSIEDRKKLLQGLIDTDGYMNKRGKFEYSTVSESLYNDFLELNRGLGNRTSQRKLIRKANSSYSDNPIYRVSEIDGYKNGIKISSIEKTGNYTEMKCIMVSNSDNLYITDDYVITHNTTGTAVLIKELVRLSQEQLKKGVSAIDLKIGIESAVKDIVQYIKESSIKVEDHFLYDIARISANNDEELGKIISEAFLMAGDNGVVSYEQSDNGKTYIDFVGGMPISRGWEFEGFVNKPENRSIEFSNSVMILLSNRKFQNIREVLPVVEYCHKNNHELLIISEMEYEVTKVLYANKKNGLKVAVIAPPSIGEKRRDYFTDISLATGGLIVDLDTSTLLEGYDMEVLLGKCDKVVVTKEDTVLFFNERPNTEAIDSKIEELNSVIKNSHNKLEIEYMQDRVSKLACGVSVIKVGWSTEVELKEKLDRVDDAIHAVKAAKSEGVVYGGGIALLNASYDVDSKKGKVNNGYNIVREAIKKPFKTILDNAGVNPSDIENQLLNYTKVMGYDVKEYEIVDMLKSGILDPAKVIRLELENAASVATTILTTNVTITHKRDESNK